MTTRVLIVDDHAIVRQGLEAVLNAHPELDVVGSAADGASAIVLAQAHQPDVVLMDLLMPEMDGIETIRQMRARGITSHIIVLTSSLEEQAIQQALQHGARGYLLKASRSTEVIRAIQDVIKGTEVLDPAVAQRLIQQIRSGDPLHELTERERQVFDLLARGQSNAEIAERLCVSEATVRTHTMNIFDKLNFRDRTQVMVYALKRGLIHLDDLP